MGSREPGHCGDTEEKCGHRGHCGKAEGARPGSRRPRWVQASPGRPLEMELAGLRPSVPTPPSWEASPGVNAHGGPTEP